MSDKYNITRYNDIVNELFTKYPAFKTNGTAAYHPGLDATRRLAAMFGNPQDRLRCVHIAGTNGKGSTSHCIAAALTASGYRTALYTSPHLTDFRERMQIDGKMIPHEAVIDFMDRFNSFDLSDNERRFSFFELTTIMALDWFCRSDVDIAVIETGLGGRLDSTNIINPELSVITNISLDHTSILGSTPVQIAQEKAGIIKEGVPVVIGAADGGVRDVFITRAAELGCPVVFADETDIRTEPDKDCTVKIAASPFGSFTSSLRGEYQHINARTALCAIGKLLHSWPKLCPESVAKAFSEISNTLHGRWETRDGVLCDTGHNADAWQYTSLYLKERSGSITAIVGFCADKDIGTIISMLPEGVRYYCVAADTPRAIDAVKLASAMKTRGLDATPYPSVGAAIEEARTNGLPEIFLGGSFFVVAEYLSGKSFN